MIKNTTPYIGKIKLKFEKYPEYTGKSKLNKIHINLGFTKLVSRITPQRDKTGWLINPQAKYLIDRHTGGMISGYIGDIERGWWYYKNNMTVCDKYPHGVATIIEYNDMYPDQQFIAGYHGYTHRGGQTFKIGDRLFDASYQPKEEDYEEWEWAGWKLHFEKRYSEGDDLDKRWMNESGISYVIPYKKRGNKVIETWEEALQAAINISKDLS